MRALSVHLNNFASYKTLDFDMTGQGLTLIQGPTGAGKSTLCDAIPWILWGTTAKGGTVTDVLSWPGNEVTQGTAVLQFGSYRVSIYRSRGIKAKDNDLYFTHLEGAAYIDVRGKDLNDTQRLINQRLGLTAELYLAGAYYHEFSQTAQFFTTTAKNRRAICEQVVDLTMPKDLQEKAKLQSKELSKKLTSLESDKASAIATIDVIKRSIANIKRQHDNWETTRRSDIEKLKKQDEEFETNKANKIAALTSERELLIAKMSWHEDNSTQLEAKIKSLSDKRCKECGSLLASDDKEELMAERAKVEKLNTYNHNIAIKVGMIDQSIEQAQNMVNTYQQQIAKLEAQHTPHRQLMGAMRQELVTAESKIKNLGLGIESIKIDIADSDLLIGVLGDFRSALIANTIADIEAKTNGFLADYFDAEMRVTFEAKDADKLEVSITKDGHLANFTQLSKGQRGILKLCFGVAVMQGVSNHHGIDFAQLFFDESIDGLDANMKLKAVRLFERLSLEHESVFLIEHASEVKASITNQYQVSLVDGRSVIEKAI